MQVSPLFAAAIKQTMPTISDIGISAVYKKLVENNINPDEIPKEQLPSVVRDAFVPKIGNTEIKVPETNADARLVKPELTAQTENELGRIQGFQSQNNALDPVALQQANQDYVNKLRQNTISGAAGNHFAALSGAFGNANAPIAQKAFNDRQDAIAKQETLGLRELLENQYKLGETMATSITNRLKTDKQFALDADKAKLEQAKMKAELIPMLNNANVAVQMADPSSIISISAREELITQLMQQGLSREAATKRVPETLSAVAVAPMAANAGVTMKQITEKAEQNLKKAEASRASAAAGVSAAEAAQKRLETTLLGNLTQGGTKVPEGSNTSISIGGVRIEPSQLTTGLQAAGAAAAEKDQAQATIAQNTNLAGSAGQLVKIATIQDMRNKATGTGMGANILSNLTPGQQEEMRQRITQMVNAKSQYDAAGGGSPVKDTTTEVNRILKLSPQAFQSEVARLMEQVDLQQDTMKRRQEYLNKNKTMAGFDPNANSKTWMVNPSTGVSIWVENKQEEAAARRSGFLKSSDLGKPNERVK